MAKKAYVGVNGVARKVKKGYIGIKTAFPIYSEETRTVAITANNISDYFTVTNGSYYFVGSGNIFSTNNAGVDSSTASTILTAKYDISALSFNYSYSSEANYDKFTLKVAGTTVENAVSGSTTSKSYSGSLKAGQTIEFTYAKDNSQSKNDDKCTFSAMNITTVVRTQTGTEMKSVARKIKKAYVGVGGVARPFWGGGEVAYYGKVEDLTSWPDMSTYSGYAATIGNYALFAGFWGYAGVVEAYNSSLIKSSPDGTGQYGLGGTGVSASKHAFLANGLRTGGKYYGDVVAYDASLTRTVATSLNSSVSGIRGASIGEYALFAGGYKTSGSTSSWYNTDIVTDYDSSLTKSIRKALSVGRSKTGTATVGNYAIFAGGYDDVNSKSLATVDAFDASLTRTIPAVLSSAIDDCPATTVGNYAIFAIGTFANAYNTSLTRSIPTVLSVSRSGVAATTVSEFALFAGGSTPSSVVDVYDTSLTRTTTTKLSVARGNMTGATVGNYALFAGGSSYNSYYDETTQYTTVDVYTVV